MATSAIESPAPTSDVWSLVGMDDDVRSDFAALGVELTDNGQGAPADVDQPHRDAMASSLMRRHAEEQAEIARLQTSQELEVALVNARYEPQLAALRTRQRYLEGAVLAIAERTKDAGGYPGKKKSRDVGAGTYGYRSYAAGVELVDEAAYIAWAEENAPATLRVKLTMTFDYARQYLSLDELEGVKREVVKKDATDVATALPDGASLPPGFKQTVATDSFYAKPLPAAVISGAQ
jgi:phage host-nuclease inhibitor protein Gam